MATQSHMAYSCSICLEIFSDPVVLSCTHSFCKECLRNWWKDRPLHQCPLCKRRSSKSDPPCNRALKDVCEAYLQDLTLKDKDEALCSQHKEKLRLFCLDDQELVCVVCRDSRTHNKHTFKPIEEAAEEFKDSSKKILQGLQDKLELCNKAMTEWDQTAEFIKAQAQCTERQIKEEFGKIQAFLQKEEQDRIAALRNEAQQKTRMMQQKIEALAVEMVALSDTIRATEEELEGDDVSFLQKYKASVRRVQEPRLTVDPELHSGALIDVAKHVGNLSFYIWNKMKEMVSYTPVILDPNTAFCQLTLSDDLRSVTCENMDSEMAFPKNPERFNGYPTVLGSEGFTSGVHSWEVEVRGNTNWAVGVMSESIVRKGDINHGYWEFWFTDGKYKAFAPPSTDRILAIKKVLRRIRVHLDFNRKKLSFSDPDTDALIYSFTHTFTERVFPLFTMVIPMQLKISPVNITVQPDI